MTRTWRKYHLLVLAVIFAAALAAGSWFATAPVYAEGDDFGKICFDGDKDYEWSHFYNVENKDATLSLDDLNITVLNKAGDEIKPSEYDLSIIHIYYDRQKDKDIEEPVEPPLGIQDTDKEQGFSEYRAIATAKDGAAVSGSVDGDFIIMDKYSLNYVCPDIRFENYEEKDDWHMRDRYWYAPGADIVASVRDCTGAELTPGTDYDITYYYRSGSPEDMDDPSIRFEDILVADDDHIVDGVLSEPGGYFASIQGRGDYYGGNDVLIDIDSTSRIFFRGDEHELWSDADLTFKVECPDGVEGKFWLGVGAWGEEDWDVLFNNEQNPDEFFEYQSGELTLHGDAIFEAIGDRDVNIYATITKEDDEDVLLAEGFADVHAREAKYEYDLPEDDNLLPGWDGWINESFSVYIENKQYPEGKDWDLTVTNATLTNVSPEGAFKLEDKDGGWEYRAEKLGRATVNLEYEDIDGTPKEHSFELSCAEHVYHVDMWPVEGINQGLPGTSIELEAYAEHQYVCRDEDNPDEWHHENTQDGLKYNWCFEKNGRFTAFSEFATITPNDKDPSKATLTFKDMPQGWDDIGEQINVAVSITDTESGDPHRERASHQRDFWVNSDYTQIMPALIDSNLDVGKSLTIEPELWHYQLGKKGHEVIDADFEIDNVDDNAIEVEEKDGEFTITRKGDWDTNFNIRADDTDQWYHLDRKNYDISFEYDELEIYDDQTLTVKLNKEDLEGLTEELADPNNKDYEIRYTVGRWNNEQEDWDVELSSDTYEADKDGITISGKTIKDANLDGVNIRAELFINREKFGGENISRDTWCWLNLRRPCRDGKHKWHKYTVREATLDNEGLEYWVCPEHPVTEGCGEFREVVIPKKIDIAKASVAAIKTVTYNKKAQKPAVTVKYNGETLKAGTDYSIAYVNNINAGKATVVLVGKDRFAGDKNATFTIAKANNPIKVSVKKPLVKFTAVKKKNQTIKQKTAYTVSGNQGKVTWKKASGNAKIAVAANGNITVKKGLKKGTYTVKVKATAAGNANYKSVTKNVTVKVAVK